MIAALKSFYQKVKPRRTVRDFSDKSIPEEVIRNSNRSRKGERAFYQSRSPDEWLAAIEYLGANEGKTVFRNLTFLVEVFLINYH